MRSYSPLLYRVEDSVVNNKAIQTYSARMLQSHGDLGQGQVSAGLHRGATLSRGVEGKANREVKKSPNI